MIGTLRERFDAGANLRAFKKLQGPEGGMVRIDPDHVGAVMAATYPDGPSCRVVVDGCPVMVIGTTEEVLKELGLAATETTP